MYSDAFAVSCTLAHDAGSKLSPCMSASPHVTLLVYWNPASSSTRLDSRAGSKLTACLRLSHWPTSSATVPLLVEPRL